MKAAVACLLAAASAASAAAPVEPVVERERDSADRHAILRWYDWGNKGEDGKFEKCEGRLDYDIDVPASGWYALEQVGMPCEWDRTILLDGAAVRKRLTTIEGDLPPGVRKDAAWRKELNLWIERGRHTLSYERTGFPGHFPVRWRLVPSDGTARGTIRVDLAVDAVRAGDEVRLEALLGTDRPMRYELVAVGLSNDETNTLAVVETDAVREPVRRTVRATAPMREGVYRVTVREDGVVGWKADTSSADLVVVATEAPAPGASLAKTLVVDIDCVATAPYVERDGATRIVEADFGSYRESSGAAIHPEWALDGFSYNYQIPDIHHTYLLEVTYPDDKFRSVGFWSNDGGVAGQKGQSRDGGQILTGGVETGGQYRNTMTMLTHEAFFYPTGTNIVLAVVNLNRGSRAAASRIRVHRIDGPLPAAPEGARRGRLAGGFFEEHGRWKRFFGLGNDPHPKACETFENLRTMNRWGEWNRFAGVNTMSPAVVAYGTVLYPSTVIDAWHVSEQDELRMLALVAEKYGNVFIPHVTLHLDQSLDARLGISMKTVDDPKAKGGKRSVPVFADPDVVEWSNDGSTEIPWRAWSYNCLHPKVQAYLIDVVGEIADRVGDTKSFGGVSLRIPLSWQFSGITGLNNAKYGYGDWTVGEFSKDTGVAVPGEAGDPKRFRRRYEFLMSDAMRPTWLQWRNDRVKDYYRRVRARLNADGGDRELYFMWWASSHADDEMNECGIDPDGWKDEPGISFYGMQFFFGRRFFAPRSLFAQQNRLYSERVLKMSRAGRRAVGIYSDYYEPNNKTFEWARFGGADYVAFDALEPAGEYERQNFAVPLAQLDAGVYFSGGNGWIFGTPAKTRDFMRAFLALPPDRFEPVPDAPQDPVAVRECVTDEGRFVYFVNGIDAPARVAFTLDGRGELVSAATGEPAAADFTLDAFGLKSFLVKKPRFGAPARVRDVSVEVDSAVGAAYAPQVAAIDAMRRLAAARKIGVELRKDIYDDAMAAAEQAVQGAAEGKFLQVAGAVCNPKLVYLYDLAGRYPPGLFQSPSGIIGGYPAPAADKPTLAFRRAWGGDPEEGPAPGAAVWSATDGTRTWLSFAAGARGQLREYVDGAYRRSGVLTWFGDDAYNTGDSWHGYLRDPAYLEGGAIVWTNGFLYAAHGSETPKYDVDDHFRQGVGGFGEKVAMPRRPAPVPVDLKPLSGNFATPSQLKTFGGKIYFQGADGVYTFDPADGRRERVLEKKGGFVFDVTPQGKIVTAPVTGGNGWEQTDLLAGDDGSIIRRVDPWDRLKFEKVAADGATEPVFDFDYRDFRQGNRFGFCRGADGVVYVAGAGSRRVAAFRADGSLLWERKWRPAQATELGDIPIRCPSSCAVDGKGRLWVADFAADKLVAFDAADGRFLGTWGVSGTVDDKTGFGFSAITGLAVLGDTLYVLDSGNLRLLAFDCP
ncbi:MAG: hypothetical protein ACOX5G_07490 [Kiritimatiellia bacterium]|jgi:hypothetical protein